MVEVDNVNWRDEPVNRRNPDEEFSIMVVDPLDGPPDVEGSTFFEIGGAHFNMERVVIKLGDIQLPPSISSIEAEFLSNRNSIVLHAKDSEELSISNMVLSLPAESVRFMFGLLWSASEVPADYVRYFHEWSTETGRFELPDELALAMIDRHKQEIIQHFEKIPSWMSEDEFSALKREAYFEEVPVADHEDLIHLQKPVGQGEFESTWVLRVMHNDSRFGEYPLYLLFDHPDHINKFAAESLEAKRQKLNERFTVTLDNYRAAKIQESFAFAAMIKPDSGSRESQKHDEACARLHELEVQLSELKGEWGKEEKASCEARSKRISFFIDQVKDKEISIEKRVSFALGLIQSWCATLRDIVERRDQRAFQFLINDYQLFFLAFAHLRVVCAKGKHIELLDRLNTTMRENALSILETVIDTRILSRAHVKQGGSLALNAVIQELASSKVMMLSTEQACSPEGGWPKHKENTESSVAYEAFTRLFSHLVFGDQHFKLEECNTNPHEVNVHCPEAQAIADELIKQINVGTCEHSQLTLYFLQHVSPADGIPLLKPYLHLIGNYIQHHTANELDANFKDENKSPIKYLIEKHIEGDVSVPFGIVRDCIQNRTIAHDKRGVIEDKWLKDGLAYLVQKCQSPDEASRGKALEALEVLDVWLDTYAPHYHQQIGLIPDGLTYDKALGKIFRKYGFDHGAARQDETIELGNNIADILAKHSDVFKREDINQYVDFSTSLTHSVKRGALTEVRKREMLRLYLRSACARVKHHKKLVGDATRRTELKQCQEEMQTIANTTKAPAQHARRWRNVALVTAAVGIAGAAVLVASVFTFGLAGAVIASSLAATYGAYGGGAGVLAVIGGVMAKRKAHQADEMQINAPHLINHTRNSDAVVIDL